MRDHEGLSRMREWYERWCDWERVWGDPSYQLCGSGAVETEAL